MEMSFDNFLWLIHYLLILAYVYGISKWIYIRIKYKDIYHRAMAEFGALHTTREDFEGAGIIGGILVTHVFFYSLAIHKVATWLIVLIIIATILFSKADKFRLWEIKQYQEGNRSQHHENEPEFEEQTQSEEQTKSSAGFAEENETEFDFEKGRWDDDRFETPRAKNKYRALYIGANDPATPSAERKRFASALIDADDGKTKGIKALPKPKST